MTFSGVQNTLLQAATAITADKQTTVFSVAEIIGGFENTLHIFKMSKYRSNANAGMVSDLLSGGDKVSLSDQFQHGFDNQLTAAVAAQAATIGFAG